MLNSVGDAIVKEVNQACNDNLAFLKFNVQYKNRIGNTHSCPRGGIKNFVGDTSIVTGYPGWKGRLWVWYHDVPKSFGSSRLDGSRIHPGSGGYGAYASIEYDAQLHKDLYILSWDCTIWSDDFQEEAKEELAHYADLYKAYKTDKAVAKINGDNINWGWKTFEYPEETFSWKSQKLLDIEKRGK